MQHKHFKAFVALAQQLHFTRAAEQLSMTQPSLSLLIRQLEERMEIELFARSTRNVALTEMGKAFYPLALTVVNDVDTAVRHMKNLTELKQGTVTVAAFPSVATNQLPHIMVEYHKRFPNVKLQVIDGIWGTVIDKVRSGVADFAIGSRPHDLQGLEFTETYRDEIMLLATRSHPLADRLRLRWEEIAGEEIVMLSQDTGVRQSIDSALDEAGITLNPIMEPALIQTAAALVSAGAGLGIILSSYLSAVQMDGLIAIPLTDPHILRPVGILTRRDSTLTPAAQMMLTMVTRNMAGRPNPETSTG